MSKKYFEDARAMFITEGWKTFVAEIDEAISVMTLDSVNGSDEFFQAKGRLVTLRQIAGYENAMLAAEAQQEADNEEAY
jgi:hypothetical protein